MSFTPNKFLNNNTNVLLRDQQHAARLFVDDQFRLAPKLSFSFHVAFGINPGACKDATLLQRHRNEINMLVKDVTLPSFSITTETVNQYNRKKAVQIQHKPGEISITFHDDNMSVINKLWQNYYTYYYADSNSANSSSAYSRNATRRSSFISSSYGLDNGSSNPFFNYITIYQMARHEFVSYKLINPIISSWDHNKLSYSDTKTHDFTMKIIYEAVAYNTGKVTDGMDGFAAEHYDLTPSPLSGKLDTTSSSPTFTEQNVIENGAKETINTIIQQVNTYQNTKTLNTAGVSGIINNLASSSNATVNGIQDITFPTKPSSSNKTVALPIKTGN